MAGPTIKTNVMDEGPYRGSTVTSLVTDSSDRNSEAVATAHGQEHDTWHRDQGGGPAPGPAPTLTSIDPTTTSASTGPDLYTLTGTGFVNGAKVAVNGIELATAFVNATTVTAGYDPPSAGTLAFTVKNPDGQVTGAQNVTVTA